MATPVEFFSLEGVHRCFFEGCEQKEGSFVHHKGGQSHPMHLSCALKMIQGKGADEFFCSSCKRPVDAESLRTLAKRDVKTLEPSSPASASSSSSEVELDDEEFARELQFQFNEEVERLNQEDQLSEALALSLEESSQFSDRELGRRAPSVGSSAQRLIEPAVTEFDELIAEDFQAREEFEQRRNQAAPPPQHVVAAARGNPAVSCGELTKAAFGVACLAFTIGMIVKAYQGV